MEAASLGAMPHSGQRDAQDLRGDAHSRAGRAWRRLTRVLSPLRRRFALLLLLLCSLMVVPWGLTVDMYDHLDGIAQQLDLASSTRKRILELTLAVEAEGMDPHSASDRIRRLDVEQQRVLTLLIEGDEVEGIHPCRGETCETLQEMKRRWSELAVPAALRAVRDGGEAQADFHRIASEELASVDSAIHEMALDAEAQIDKMTVAGGLATLGALILITLVAMGVAVVIEQVRRVQLASRRSVEAVAALGGGHDEIAALARTLAESMHALELQTEAEMIQRALHESERHARLAELLATMPSLKDGARDLYRCLAAVVRNDVAVLHVAPRGDSFSSTWRMDPDGEHRGTEPCTAHPTDAAHVVERPGSRCTALSEDEVATAVEVPLRAGDHAVGVLVLGRREGDFDEQDLAAARRLAPVLASALDRMRLEREVRSSEQAAALAGITRMVAHEVRNPLNSLGLHAQLLERRLERLPSGSREMAVKHIQILRAEVTRLDSLVRDYLSLSPGRHTELGPVDLGDLLADVASVLQPQLAEQDITMSVVAHAGPRTVLADRSKLAQVMHNLVRNAAEALADSDEKRITLGSRELEAHIEVFVRDTGPGLKDLEEIFLPSYTTKAAGTGMGLAISRRIAELLGGTLEARRPAGGGAELVLTLQLTEPDQAAAAS